MIEKILLEKLNKNGIFSKKNKIRKNEKINFQFKEIGKLKEFYLVLLKLLLNLTIIYYLKTK